MVKLDALTKHFSGVLALDSVTHQFPDRGVVSIIGPNGAGKSTLVNVITGFAKPDSGEWFISNTNASRLKPWDIAQLGVARTFQQIRLAESMTPEENLRLACRTTKENLWRALTGIGRGHKGTVIPAELEDLGLPMWERPVSEMSYGQKKLLSLACCLISGARVLVLDEPVAGVHPSFVQRIVSVLGRYAAKGCLVILIEHDLEFVKVVSDEVVVMDSGRLVHNASVSSVFGSGRALDVFIR